MKKIKFKYHVVLENGEHAEFVNEGMWSNQGEDKKLIASLMLVGQGVEEVEEEESDAVVIDKVESIDEENVIEDAQ